MEFIEMPMSKVSKEMTIKISLLSFLEAENRAITLINLSPNIIPFAWGVNSSNIPRQDIPITT